MNTADPSLDQLLDDNLREGAFVVPGGRDLYMEVMDNTTGLVWMSAAPVQFEDFEALQLDDTLTKVGCASASMDRAAFQYSPGVPNGPVRQRLIEDRLYINVAAPGEAVPPAQSGGPIEISVNKAHVVGFEAGRSVTVLRLPEGDFVEVVSDDAKDESLVLPEGGTLTRIELSRPWVVTLPTPTRAFFWFDKNMRSFQGPVTLPESA